MNRNTVLGVAALLVILATGLVVSQFASSEPDGLEFVAEQEGFADTAEGHTLDASPLADYGNDGLSRALAALVGIAVTLGGGFALFKVLSRPSHPTNDTSQPGQPD